MQISLTYAACIQINAQKYDSFDKPIVLINRLLAHFVCTQIIVQNYGSFGALTPNYIQEKESNY